MTMNNIIFKNCLIFVLMILSGTSATSQDHPGDLTFVRQGVKRMIFDEGQSLVLAKLDPGNLVGLEAMHPISHHNLNHAEVEISSGFLAVQSDEETETSIWFGGFNPYATYTLDISACTGKGSVGFEFADSQFAKQFIVSVEFDDNVLTGVNLKIINNLDIMADEFVSVNHSTDEIIEGKIILQLLGSGFVLYLDNKYSEIPTVIAQSDFNKYMDLRDTQLIQALHSNLHVSLSSGKVNIRNAEMAFTTGVGQADIRAITYENGDPLLDQGRLWYTMSIRGWALPHHIQGVFSMNPTLFDVKLEGIVLFDRDDGILRNEIASHIFYDRNEKLWRGITTGFSAFARPQTEKKQLLSVESIQDPRFGFSVMQAEPFGLSGDIEDPHILYDTGANKWRILTCTNQDGYKAIMLESDYWNRDYRMTAGPVKHNSTGTSIQKIGNTRYCFSGSSDRSIYIYSYPDLEEKGTLKMDLPPWDEESGTRVWPNIVQLPEGYPVRYVALMFDRYNFPGMQGPNWTYGALYKYHGYTGNDEGKTTKSGVEFPPKVLN